MALIYKAGEYTTMKEIAESFRIHFARRYRPAQLAPRPSSKTSLDAYLVPRTTGMSMKISCHRIIEDAHLAATPAEAFLDPWKQGEGQYWIEIHAYQPRELEEWLSKLKLSELAITCCVEPTFTSRVVPLDDAVFFEFPVYAG